MMTLGEQDLNGVTRNLTTELTSAREQFRHLSQHIKQNTSRQRADIVDQLDPFLEAVQSSNRALIATVASLVDGVDRTWTVAAPWLDSHDSIGTVIWSFALTIAIAVLLITVLLVASLSYGCVRAENRAGAPFIVAACAMSVSSLALMVFAIFGMLLGGHAEVFVCRALFDYPDFMALGKLFDRPGLMYVNGSEAGIIDDLLRPHNGSSRPAGDRINATLVEALLLCEKGAPAYGVFQLDSIMNVSHTMNYSEYGGLVAALDRLNVSTVPLCSITDPLQSIFEDMYVIDIDLGAYRSAINQPAPERDMTTFIDQLQHVAMQVQDVGSTSRMATLGQRARRIQASVLQPLEQIRGEIVYHLTALELQRAPWTNQVNQSLWQLKTTQSVLNRDADAIFATKTREFQDRCVFG